MDSRLEKVCNYDDDYYIEKCAEWIAVNELKMVALEFSEHHEISPTVSQLIKEKSGVVPIVMADSNRACGECCVDERTAVPRNIEGVIHFGRTCLTPTKKLPVLYIIEPLPLNVHLIIEKLKSCDDDLKLDDNLVLVYDTAYVHTIGGLASEIKREFKNLVISKIITSENAEIVRPITSTSQNNSEIENTLESLHLKTVKFNSREVNIRSELNISDYNFIYIGPKTPSLTSLQLRFAQNTFYQIDGLAENISVSNFVKTVMNRSKKIELVKESKIIGILFTLIKGHDEITDRLKKLIRNSGKKCYSFFIGKVNEAKLGNIVGVDVFVYVACPESSLFDRNENPYIYQKIVAPWEVEVALNPAFEWSLNFETNFQEFLTQDLSLENYNEQSNDDTNRYVHTLIKEKITDPTQSG